MRAHRIQALQVFLSCPDSGLRLLSCSPARAGKVGRGDLDTRSHRHGAWLEQGLLSVDSHAQSAVREARRHPDGARALEAVRVFDRDDDAVLEPVVVGGEEREAGDVRDLRQGRNRGRHCERRTSGKTGRENGEFLDLPSWVSYGMQSHAVDGLV